jgi:hypothetical protein
MPKSKSESEPDDFIWRVTSTEGDVTLAFGPKLSEAPYSDEAKLHFLGKALINLGTRLMGSTTSEDDDDWDGSDEWDSDEVGTP